jgi:catechol 2,3-dioxygenase-like lactoylglutathione lyase family enzyme
MLATAKLMAFVATSDGVRARAFYEGILGLPVISDDDFALALDAGGTMLRVQKVERTAPPPFTVLGWQVVDIAAVVNDLAKRGVTFEIYSGMGQAADGIWRSPTGARVAWFKDPDGNTLSLTQMP